HRGNGLWHGASHDAGTDPVDKHDPYHHLGPGIGFRAARTRRYDSVTASRQRAAGVPFHALAHLLRVTAVRRCRDWRIPLGPGTRPRYTDGPHHGRQYAVRSGNL